jgi:hypothetical protein
MFTQKYMSISTRKTSVSYLALSGILLLHLLAFYPDYTKGEQVDIGSAQGFQAAWEQGGDYKLPQDWFPKHISDRQDPAELELPLKELWRFGGFSKTMPFVLGVEAYDDLVFLSYSIPDPNSDPKSARKRAKSIVACKQLRTGETVWSVADIGGRLACIPGLAFRVIYWCGRGIQYLFSKPKPVGQYVNFRWIRWRSQIGTHRK